MWGHVLDWKVNVTVTNTKSASFIFSCVQNPTRCNFSCSWFVAFWCLLHWSWLQVYGICCNFLFINYKTGNTPRSNFMMEKHKTVSVSGLSVGVWLTAPRICLSGGYGQTKVRQSVFHPKPKLNSTSFYGCAPLGFMTEEKMAGRLRSVEVITAEWPCKVTMHRVWR